MNILQVKSLKSYEKYLKKTLKGRSAWLQTNSEIISISANLIHEKEQDEELRNSFRINSRQVLKHIFENFKE